MVVIYRRATTERWELQVEKVFLLPSADARTMPESLINSTTTKI